MSSQSAPYSPAPRNEKLIFDWMVKRVSSTKSEAVSTNACSKVSSSPTLRYIAQTTPIEYAWHSVKPKSRQ